MFSLGFLTIALTGCAPNPPKNQNNVCEIFREYPSWYWAAKDVRHRWKVPISTLMAVVYQESRFKANAKPPRGHILWIIPWFRPTSAEGYAQVVDPTWERYKKERGKTWWTDRSDFSDAIHFMGWYINRAAVRAGLSKRDTYAVYLAYHEGIGGYMRGTYRQKAWLMAVARKVQRRAWMYRSQLLACEASLPQKPWWRVW